MTSSVKECAPRARSGELHVVRVHPVVVVDDAVVGLTLSLIALVVIVVTVVAI